MAYRTGRGRIIVRGQTDVELLDSKTKRTAIIIKEIPYQTNKASLVEKIADLVENKEAMPCIFVSITGIGASYKFKEGKSIEGQGQLNAKINTKQNMFIVKH
ncbi:unnamed protein product [Ilex paraguariensis]|uniref:Topo IIA-type catalytic domain-containing protein n=1 Tax=Ilex paraguariensis TaxID=185542 RepID=A0ABC8T2J1_9AQUA